MTQMTTVPLETADFLLGRLIATIKSNDELNKQVIDYKERNERQFNYIQKQNEEIALLSKRLHEATQPKKRRGRPKGSKSKAKVVSK
jgi:hypothetical protein